MKQREQPCWIQALLSMTSAMVCLFVLASCGGDSDEGGEAKTQIWRLYVDGVEVGEMRTYHPGDTGGGDAVGEISADGKTGTLTGTLFDGRIDVRIDMAEDDVITTTGTYDDTTMTGIYVTNKGETGVWSATALPSAVAME